MGYFIEEMKLIVDEEVYVFINGFGGLLVMD